MEDLDKKIGFLKEYIQLCEKHQLHLTWGYENIYLEGIKETYPYFYEVVLKILGVNRYNLADKLGIDDWELVEDHFKTELNKILC